MSDVKKTLIQKAKKNESVLRPFSGLELIENLLLLTREASGTTHAMRTAAYKATEFFGHNWAEKEPEETRDVQIREMLRQMVMRSGDPKSRGRFVRWQRFQEFGRHTYLDQMLSPPSNKKGHIKQKTGKS